jgi:hypothetical protein
MSYVFINEITVPSGGTYTEYSGLTFSTGSLTKIAGILDTTLGLYFRVTGNGINGGIPNQGPLSFTLFSATTSTIPSGGTYTEYSGLTFSTGTLTKIAGVLNTTLGSYRLPLIARGLIGGSAPSQFPAPIIFVST